MLAGNHDPLISAFTGHTFQPCVFNWPHFPSWTWRRRPLRGSAAERAKGGDTGPPDAKSAREDRRRAGQTSRAGKRDRRCLKVNERDSGHALLGQPQSRRLRRGILKRMIR